MKKIELNELQLKIIKYSLIDKLDNKKKSLEFWEKNEDDSITLDEKNLMIATTQEAINECNEVLNIILKALYK